MRWRGLAAALALVCAAALGLASLCADVRDAPGTDPTQGAEGQGAPERPVAEEVDRTLGDLGVSPQRSERVSERSVAREAGELLEERRARGDCVLARSGYLDLFGRTWGCVLQGNGWVEICLVSGTGADEGCVVVSWLMSAADVAGRVGEAA